MPARSSDSPFCVWEKAVIDQAIAPVPVRPWTPNGLSATLRRRLTRFDRPDAATPPTP